MSLGKLWRPKRVLVTRSAREWAHGRVIAERCAGQGLDVIELPNDRLQLGMPDDERQAYALAKQTLAVTVASPSQRR